ncbi:MAG: hypothetical protein RIR70_841 [Pseudomonadota bacterium]|jgi:phospholipid/cholesterol/gamma-HCH transport system permease protein
MTEPLLTRQTIEGRVVFALTGRWTLEAVGPRQKALLSDLHEAAKCEGEWDLRAIAALDSAGALMLWRAWGSRLPARCVLPPEREAVFARLARLQTQTTAPTPRPKPMPLLMVARLGAVMLAVFGHLRDLVALVGELVLDVLHVLRHPSDAPWKEFSATLYKAGARAMPICALLGFLIGVVLSYLSALQLRNFGAETFIVNILGLGLVRELGPVLVAVLVAGRSGSAMTAQLGVMRVTEEIDALASMGVSRTLRLVLPKVAALSLATPLLVLWTTAAALLGGMVAADWQLDMSYGFFLESLPRVVRVANLFIGLAKGVAFGFAIALLACHFGLRVVPNTESLSANTTTSVVVAISVVIFIDAIFALVMRGVGVGG